MAFKREDNGKKTYYFKHATVLQFYLLDSIYKYLVLRSMKLAGFIISFWLLFLSFLPCGDRQDCNIKSTITISANSGHNDHKHETEHCTPFCTCSCCTSLTVQRVAFLQVIEKPVFEKINYAIYQAPSCSNVSYAIWQPPKIS